MNLLAIEELVLQMMLEDQEAIATAKGMFELIRKDPQKSVVQFLGSAPSLMKHEEKSAWVYGIVCGIAMSAASSDPSMNQKFKR